MQLLRTSKGACIVAVCLLNKIPSLLQINGHPQFSWKFAPSMFLFSTILVAKFKSTHIIKPNVGGHHGFDHSHKVHNLLKYNSLSALLTMLAASQCNSTTPIDNKCLP